MAFGQTPITDQIIDKFLAAGYDGFTAISEAKRIMEEFKAYDGVEKTWGIMGAHGKCVDTVTLRRRQA